MLFPPGIKNSGNSCYLASILQCLNDQEILAAKFHCMEDCRKGSTINNEILLTSGLGLRARARARARALSALLTLQLPLVAEAR